MVCSIVGVAATIPPERMTEPSETPGLSHQQSVVIPWGHCDHAGIVFYPRYYEMFDASTHAMLRAVGLDHRTLRDKYSAVGLTLVETNARYLKPVRFDEEVVVRSRIERLGQRSLRVRHVIESAAGVAVDGWEARVWAVMSEGRLATAAIPTEVRAVLQPGGA